MPTQTANLTGDRMMNKAQVKKAYKNGDLDEVAKELSRYGVITKDSSFDVDIGHHAGSHRKTDFLHYGHAWRVDKHNGSVLRISLSL